jgi:hypothetical protein
VSAFDLSGERVGAELLQRTKLEPATRSSAPAQNCSVMTTARMIASNASGIRGLAMVATASASSMTVDSRQLLISPTEVTIAVGPPNWLAVQLIRPVTFRASRHRAAS